MNSFQAANAWDAKKTFIARNEVEVLSCDNVKADLADGQEAYCRDEWNWPGDWDDDEELELTQAREAVSNEAWRVMASWVAPPCITIPDPVLLPVSDP